MIKYSEIKTSNGTVTLNESNPTYKINTTNWEYLKIYSVVGTVKIYINNSTDFIEIRATDEFILEDFAINNLMFEFSDISGSMGCEFCYYLLK
ncbi:hypothetical protein OSC52_00320 [Clostridium pasteurianum]|uniref:hypothetical protein n=1 Tax=Clostridium pasteurianum TaxID=1501 RepID=UPI002260EF54|nr:hypothetical protein [Clostridium pasteurianum]UZW14351.1 hypothetical protein OSC52_00320 [Clostridium pasteurianum]